jgi:branched-chain amino acid transport system substrate-binding protein
VSSEALAVAPIVQKAGVPIIYTQSGIDGLLAAGNRQFRASPPQKTLWPIVSKHIADSGAKRVAIFNSATNPTYHEVGGKILPPLLATAGVEVAKSFEIEGTVTDFQAPVGSALATHPDAVVATLIGSQIPTLVVQLRQAGYTGPVYTGAVNTDKDLATMGKNGVGIMFVGSYSPAATGAGPAAFTTAYKAEYGGLPDSYAAEAYDATWWLARAIKKAGSVDHDAVAKALKEVGGTGFTGAQGPLTFDNGNDARAKGLLVRWDGNAQTIVVE